ncbi:unnamed protein product [Camellia sinensis]
MIGRLSDHEVHERYNQECCFLFNMFDNRKIDAKKLDAALKSLAKKYYYSGTGCCRFIHCGDVAGNSLSQPSSKVPHEVAAGGFANVSGDATSSMNAPREGDLEMGRANNNGDPPAPGDVPSSVVPRVAHIADRSSEYGVNVARTVFRVSAAASCTTTSSFAKASYAIGLADSGVAILLADTHWKAATPILAKAGFVACAVGVLADMVKDLPCPCSWGL